MAVVSIEEGEVPEREIALLKERYHELKEEMHEQRRDLMTVLSTDRLHELQSTQALADQRLDAAFRVIDELKEMCAATSSWIQNHEKFASTSLAETQSQFNSLEKVLTKAIGDLGSKLKDGLHDVNLQIVKLATVVSLMVTGVAFGIQWLLSRGG